MTLAMALAKRPRGSSGDLPSVCSQQSDCRRKRLEKQARELEQLEKADAGKQTTEVKAQPQEEAEDDSEQVQCLECQEEFLANSDEVLPKTYDSSGEALLWICKACNSLKKRISTARKGGDGTSWAGGSVPRLTHRETELHYFY